MIVMTIDIDGTFGRVELALGDTVEWCDGAVGDMFIARVMGMRSKAREIELELVAWADGDAPLPERRYRKARVDGIMRIVAKAGMD